jgi:hypothetical protein
VAKATFGIFNHTEFANFSNPMTFLSPFNKNSPTQYAYRWNPQRPCSDYYCTNVNYTPGDVNLDVNGPAFLSAAGPANNIVNPDLKWGVTHELTASIERELVPSVSLRGLWVYKSVFNETAARTFVNVLRPYTVYNQVFMRRDPGPDGVVGTADDSGLVAVYDYDPAYRGAKFVGNEIVNVPSNRNDWYHNVEVTLNKRPGTGKWYANTSFLATRNHRWLEGIAETPNSNNFPLDETWSWNYRLAGGYDLPYGFMVSTLYQIFSGVPLQRTTIFRASDPNGGPSFPSSSTITLRMEPFGAEHLPNQHLMNVRLSKTLTHKLRVELDLFNALNTNVAFSSTRVSGPTFGYITSYAQPRVVRVGSRLEF